MKSLLFILVLTLTASTTYGFVFEAEFTDLGDSPISSISDIRLKVFNPTKSCLLFEENFNIDLSSSNGKVSLELGTGSNIYLSGSYSSPTEILINNGQLNGQSACTYNPAPTDGRILEVSFDDGTNGLEVLGDVNINPAPQATYASHAGAAGQLILDNGGLTTTFATQASGNYTLSFPPDAGTSGQLLSTDGTGALSWTSSANTNASTICTAGEYLDGDGSCYPASPGISSLNGQVGPSQSFAVGTAGVTPSFTSSTDVHTLDIPLASNVGVTSGTISKADYDNFNNKQNAIPIGTTAQYLRGDLTLSPFNLDVLSTMLTGYSSGPGAVTASDSILQAIQKLDGNIAAITPPVNTDGLIEGSSNLYFTDTRAKTAAVINSTVGAEVDQAPSVSAMKAYVMANGGSGDILNGGNTTGAPITIGTNDNFPFNLEVNNNTVLTILADGKLGIGTAAPAHKFTVHSDEVGVIQRDDPGTTSKNVLDLVGSNSAGPGAVSMKTILSFSGETDTESSIKKMAMIESVWSSASDASPSGELRFRTSDAGSLVEQMLISSNGNVSIGGAAPLTKLNVDGTVKIGNGAEVCASSPDGGMIRYNAGSLEYCNGAAWQNLSGAGSAILNGGNSFAGAAMIGTNDSHPVIIRTNSTDAMYILPDGKVGIGTNSPTEKLQVTGNLRVQGTTDCTLGTGAGATNCTSDERLKDNITPINHALEKIKSLKGVEFVWNHLARSPGRSDIGVIAQDIQKVFPTAVIENQEGFLSVDYAVLVAPLIESVKELDHINREILAENEDIKAENAAMKQELTEIKHLVCSLKPHASLCQ